MYIAVKEIELSYADTDMMGVIYHANYIKWLELGREKLIKDVGFDYLDMEKAGYYAPVYNLNITYRKSLKLGDKVFVKTWVEKNQGLKTEYGFQIVNGDGEVCAEGSTTHIVVRKDEKGEFKPVQFKKAFPDWFQKYEEIKKK
ncbi:MULTISPECIES: acyl-CoA thioesterase [Bacillus]|jgi:acyl-CoA thioester hydrolase|uniref:YbgC/YbaW family acyl-CoA thioester hydrolase n=1 Tax=Bacillus smithii 7_3_47FAA TaxID=665952 RepID=G9QKL3_9BACI|nr:thioesterase family protein [Bacillus smithii]AKP46060.1 4-hydroxybenzoyl-CoA thioesterase family active site [Bacillus smithii]EHL78312.1 YbgC/YbaW family acyl-CoA thioester hydrolase [Bacillus smithii 7_3_47FAA]MED0659542.1 thioesterase family protein [Bacillus smithii]MED1420298.1 thioesterase family protein [Bacillus smithii]MED1456339.1 thioesterase family protein [Bacillus smithii]